MEWIGGFRIADVIRESAVSLEQWLEAVAVCCMPDGQYVGHILFVPNGAVEEVWPYHTNNGQSINYALTEYAGVIPAFFEGRDYSDGFSREESVRAKFNSGVWHEYMPGTLVAGARPYHRRIIVAGYTPTMVAEIAASAVLKRTADAGKTNSFLNLKKEFTNAVAYEDDHRKKYHRGSVCGLGLPYRCSYLNTGTIYTLLKRGGKSSFEDELKMKGLSDEARWELRGAMLLNSESDRLATILD